MIDGKHLAQNIHYSKQSGLAMTFSADQVLALSSYIAMLEKSLIKYCAHLAREPEPPVPSNVIIEDLVRDIEVALEGIKQRMAKDG